MGRSTARPDIVAQPLRTEEGNPMSTDATSRSRSGTAISPWASGLALFAGIAMIIGGIWHALAGLSALFNDKVYVTTPEYIYAFDLTTWGWVQLLLGLVVAGAGVSVVKGQTWGHIIAIMLVGLSLIANFVFIPHYPVWSILIIALDIAIIWALCTYRREAA
jgi:hypothetical protein